MIALDVVPTSGVLLSKAEALTIKGDYVGSNKILDGMRENLDINHTVHLDASINLLYARNVMQMGLNAEVRHYIDLIPPGIGDVYPKIDADKRSISGILLRRGAYMALKGGNTQDALEMAEKAIFEFSVAESSAIMAFHDGKRLLFNTQLNRLYTLGLIQVIQGGTQKDFEPLVVAAVIAESESRRHMTEDNRDMITGITIVADLAYGAGVTIAEVQSLSENVEFRKACRALFSRGNESWPEYLMNECFPYKASKTGEDKKSRVLTFCEGPEPKPEIIAKALLLGCKILLSDQVLDGRLLVSYACELQYHKRLLGRCDTDHGIVKQIHEMIQRLPEHVYQYSNRWRTDK